MRGGCHSSGVGAKPKASTGSFVSATGRAGLADLTRYLTAIRRRLKRLPHAIEADRERMQRAQQLGTPRPVIRF
jgi:hypothetical protein